MIKLFGNLKTRTKFLLNNGILIISIVSLALIAYKGMKDGNRLMDEMVNDHFFAVSAAGDIKADLNGVRAVLVAMMAETDKEKQKAAHETIKKLTMGIDDKFKTILADNKFPQDMIDDVNGIKKVWEEFRDTRDSQLIPFIYEGKIQDAKALALGIQAERYKKFTGLITEFLKKEKGEAEELVKDYAAATRRFNKILLIFSLVGISSWILFTILVHRFVISPIIKLTSVAEKVAKGELDTEFASINTKCEVGHLSEAISLMLKNLRSIISNLTNSINTVASAATELAATSEQMSVSANSQASQINTVSTSTEEMEKVVMDVAKNSSEAAQASVSVKEAARNGNEIVSKSSDVIAVLGENSKKINEIVKVIEDIAGRTDLLAVNAAIEAANAGDYGKGFAVVADEVRKLAERTTRATGEIGKMIEAIQKTTSEAINSMAETSEAITTITAEIDKVSGMIERIATAAEEQAASVESITQHIKDVSTSSHEFTSGTSQAAQAADDLGKLATNLQELVNRFKLKREAKEAEVS